MRVNIIGAGLAGLSAALTLAREGFECNLFSIQQSERAQSVMAEGGINAVLDTMDEDDKIEYHIRDTMDGGAELADPNAVEGMCRQAPAIIKELEQLGVPFGKNEKGIIQRNFGGQKKKRTAFVKSSTGKMLMSRSGSMRRRAWCTAFLTTGSRACLSLTANAAELSFPTISQARSLSFTVR